MAIVVTELSTNDMMYLEGVINEAINNGQTVKVSQHTVNGQIMVKRGGSTWTPLFGKDVTERPEPMDRTDIMRKWADKIESVYAQGTNGDNTALGILAHFVDEWERSK